MSFMNRLQQLSHHLRNHQRRSGRRIQRRRPFRNLAMEALEGRALLTTITVTSLADDTLENLAGDGHISLREAIQAANTDSSVDGSPAGSGADSIVFDTGLVGTITLAGTQLTISGDLSIAGPGASQLTISGNDASRIFSIAAGITADISDLAIAHGSAYEGGGIHNKGMLTIANTFSENSASSGAAIWSDMPTSIADSTLSENTARGSGGGPCRTVSRP